MNKPSRAWFSVPGLLLLASLAWTTGVEAQGTTTSAISGVVRSSEGTPVPSAEVVVRNVNTGVTNRALTSGEGRYYIPFLKPGGGYTVEVNALGYSTAIEENISLTLSSVYALDFSLRTEALAAGEIRVTTARGDVFSPSRMGAQTSVSERQINDQPTIDRHINDLAALSPYVSVTGDAPSIGGQNNRMNNIQIDGAVNNDVFGLAASGVPGGQANAKPISIAAIEQFEVLVAPFDVRHAGFSGGLVNAVTRSGTNEWRGSVFGFYRNENFLNKELPYAVTGAGGISLTDTLTTEEFLDRTVGFSLGGPLIQDRLHLFTAGEFQERRFPQNFGITSDPAAIRQAPDSINRFISILENQYGLNAGDPSAYSMENPNSNFFARLDWTVNDDHRVTLRHNWVSAADDDSPSRGGSSFELSSATYDFTSVTNSTVLQLHSTLSDQSFNELLVNYQRIRDRRSPEGNYPLIRVDNESTIGGGNTVEGTLVAGAEFFSQANELDQDIFQVTDNFTRLLGSHRVTVGGQVEYYGFRNLFAPGSLGEWRFDSLDDLAAGNATQYFINTIYPGVDDVASRFGVLNTGLYGQDEWTVNDQLTLTAGLRLDAPFMLDEPRANPDVQTSFGVSTSTVPSGNISVSPRVGFNWQTDSGYATQVRGGVGLFTGRPPFVWLSNQFGNTGRELIGLNCSGANTPAFNLNSRPTTCADGVPPTAGGVAIVNVFDQDFQFPQDLKVSLGFDRELPWGIRGTVEGLYTRAINQIALQDLNIVREPNAQPEPGIGDRPIFGTRVDFSFDAMRPNRVDPSFGPVVQLTNLSKNYSYMLLTELERRFFDVFDVRAAYTYSRAFDTRSLTNSTATSNFGYNPISGDPNNPDVATSSFDRPHRILVSATAEMFEDFGGTRVTVFYNGRSGRPYSYVYDGDVNGDGYETFGVVNNRNNDLFYVPGNISEITFNPGGRPASEDARLLQELISLEECLQDQAGSIMERNSCRAPWANALNLKLEQGLPIPTERGNVQLTLDVFNLLNLLNEDWGLEQAPLFSEIDVLQLRGRDNATGHMQFDYDGWTRSNEQTGTVHAVKPYTTFFSSRWNVQAGVKISF